MFKVIDWLFDSAPEGWFAQTGFARADKRALIWLPGRKTRTQGQAERALAASSLVGCTQLAFPAPFVPVSAPENAECLICWVGLDIDGDENALTLPEMVCKLRELCPGASLRLSQGGEGVHVLYRLAEPLKCRPNQANAIIRRINHATVEAVELGGIKVCKADRRLFWLSGGKNEWTHQTEERIEAKISLAAYSSPEPVAPQPVPQGYSPEISQWIARFQKAGVLRDVKAHNLIYVGDAVKVLKACGVKVKTKSGCSGNGQVNGYIDIGPDSISLWAYADGFRIWAFSDVESVCESFFGE